MSNDFPEQPSLDQPSLDQPPVEPSPLDQPLLDQRSPEPPPPDLTDMFRSTSAGEASTPPTTTTPPTTHRGALVASLVTAVIVLVSASLGFAVGHATAPASRANVPVTPGTEPSITIPGFSTPPAASGQPSAKQSSFAKQTDQGLVDINTSSAYQPDQSAGTGMIISKNGLILTNNHVIAGATDVSIRLISTGQTYTAKVLGYSLTSDIALLKISGVSNLPTVTLGDSNYVSTKEKVIGVGNAGGAGGTPSVAAGTVTGLNQSVTVNGGPLGSEHLTGLIATSAPIQPGDSGGPLVGDRGRVIGIDTAASTRAVGFGSTSSTLAYSIPINAALEIVNTIKSGAASSTVHVGPSAMLGVDIATPNTAYLSPSGQQTTPASSGATIAAVIPATPAASSSLAAGDTITSVNGTTIASPADLTKLITTLTPGTSVKITYSTSGGVTNSTTITLGTGASQ